jgi:hypothetical protein
VAYAPGADVIEPSRTKLERFERGELLYKGMVGQLDSQSDEKVGKVVFCQCALYRWISTGFGKHVVKAVQSNHTYQKVCLGDHDLAGIHPFKDHFAHPPRDSFSSKVGKHL